MSKESELGPLNAGFPARKRKLKILIAAAGAAAMLGLATSLWFGGVLSAKKTKSVAIVSASEPTFVETPEMVSNLDAGPHRLSFAKIQCKIELQNTSEVGPFTAAMPRIVDLIQTYLRETRPEELRSDTGTYRLKEALLLRASLGASNVHVKDVLLEELIVQ